MTIMTRERALLCAGLLFLSAGAARGAVLNDAAAERVYTLDDAVNLALKNDSRLLSAEQDRVIAEERVREAKLQFLPEFGLHGSATKFNARYPFALSQEFRNILLYPGTPENIYSARGYMYFPIYEGGRSINTVRLAQAAFKQTQSNYESVRREVVMAVKDAFQRLLFSQECAALAQQSLQAARSAAESSRLDVWERIEVNALLGQARLRSAEAERDLRLARLAFLKALNQEIDISFRVAGSLDSRAVDVDPQKVALWAMELRPELQAETYRAEMDAIGVNLAWGRRNPTLFVASDYEVTAQHFPLRNNNWDLGIGIRIPLTYDFFTKLRQKRAEQRQGQLKRAAFQDQVRLEVRQACEHLQYWQAEMSSREAQYRTVAALFDSLPSGGAALARLKAFTSVMELRLSYLTAVTEHILARARLERAVGRDLVQ